MYDLILFGVTGFTGKLATEYIVKNKYLNGKFAVCARNPTKAKKVLEDLGCPDIPVLQANNVCETQEQLDQLKSVVQQTKVVATAVGPFEKYGKSLIQLCAECGVHYADITGETDFVRHAISNLDKDARQNKATIIPHCGNDCIPHDLVVYEMVQFAAKQNMELTKVETFCEFPPSASVSGGTATTASFQLNKKNRGSKPSGDFDPLLTTAQGTKSDFSVKNISPKSTTYSKTINQKVGPWIMGPVMVNCVRRSNALLGYATTLQVGDSKVAAQSWTDWAQESWTTGRLAAGIVVPSLGSVLLPSPGQGPDRQVMEEGYFTLTAVAEMKPKDATDDDGDVTKHCKAVFDFRKDTGYLYTAAMLVETCMVLLAKEDKPSGILTPASALGHDLTQRILDTMEVSLEIKDE